MEISAKDLIEFGTEVDMPVWKEGKAITPKTIKYDKESKSFVLAVIKTGEIEYRYKDLKDLVRTTNQIYEYDDKAVD